jgi:hypothetical protein
MEGNRTSRGDGRETLLRNLTTDACRESTALRSRSAVPLTFPCPCSPVVRGPRFDLQTLALFAVFVGLAVKCLS